MLSFANIRKTKGNTVLLLLMFLIAGLLMNAGLLVFVDFGNNFNRLTEELNTSNIYYLMSTNIYNSEVENYIKTNDNIINYQEENSIWAYGDSTYKNESRSDVYLINNADNTREVSKWKFVGEHLEADSSTIYLPYRYQLDSGYKLNDKFEITVKNTTFTFTIKGFVEDTFFSSSETGVVGVYLPESTFNYVDSQLDDNYNATLIFANLKEVNKDIENEIRNMTNAESLMSSISSVEQGKSLFSFDISIIKMARIMMATMVALMIVAFALIIVTVCLIVIRFRISNSIEDDMTKIGSLKAIGYKSKEIISSIVLQFLIIALIGSVIGISLSYLTIPTLSDVFAQQSGIKWEQGFDNTINVVTLFSIIVIVILVAVLTSRRINKLHPIVALRGGIITHSFRKNVLPLSSTLGKLPVVLAIKSIFINLKQSLMMVIILIAVSFAGTFAVIMYYNTNVDTKTFLETPGIELSNVVVILDTSKDNSDLINEIKQMNEVRKVQFIDQVALKVQDSEAVAFVMDDYTQKETNIIYEGRYPLHSNEVAISGYIANIYGKKIGDKVVLKIGNTENEFLITGLTQGAFMSGMNISMLIDSVKMLNPEFKQQSLQIYLDKGNDTEQFVQKLESLYSNDVITIANAEKSMEMGASSYISIVSQVGIMMSVVTVAVVILVLYFIINSSVIRRKRELGIQKALGFTTFQLMNQLSLGFIFPIIIGVIIGSILGLTQTNVMMSVVQRAMGIMKANYIIKPLWIAIFGLIIIFISYITSMLLTYRIRKISPYTLVSE